MCGIVGYIGKRDVAPLLLEGLQRLEYRGYDSAGIVVTSPKTAGLKMVKAKGRVRDLEAKVPARFKGTTGIAHTRWATHGAPSDVNAHPHMSADEKVAVVHNGIIDNAGDLRRKLEADGVEFLSETDTEVLTHLIARSEAGTLEEKVRVALRLVEGTYGIAVMHADFSDRIVVARNGSPVVLGIGEKEMFVASDIAALVAHTRQIVTLDDGEMATLKADDFRTYTTEARGPPPSPPPWSGRPPPTTWAATTRTCTRRSTSRPRPWTGCCAAASTTGSPPCTSAASTSTPARRARCAG